MDFAKQKENPLKKIQIDGPAIFPTIFVFYLNQNLSQNLSQNLFFFAPAAYRSRWPGQLMSQKLEPKQVLVTSSLAVPKLESK